MQCRHCSHENEVSAKFCSACGQRLPVADQSTEAVQVVAGDEAVALAELESILSQLRPGDAVIVVESGEIAGSRFMLEGSETTIGRHPDSNIFLDDITVSRRHARLVAEGDGYTLIDAGALNGTYCNGSMVDTVRLQHGDQIQIGRFRLHFYLAGVPVHG